MGKARQARKFDAAQRLAGGVDDLAAIRVGLEDA
jgi:hypothetical protein